MTVKIHHASQKLASKHGLTLTVVENDVVCVQLASGRTLASGATGKIALDKALTKLNGQALVAEKAPARTLRDKLKDTVAKITGKKRRAADVDEDDDESEDLGGDDAEGDVEDEGDVEGDEDSGRSIVKRKYKTAYRPFKQTCGDEMAQLISKHVKVEVKVTLPSGKVKKVLRIDRAKLKRLAKANGCWDERYEHLNVGQARMSVGVRLRAMVKHGEAVKWA